MFHRPIRKYYFIGYQHAKHVRGPCHFLWTIFTSLLSWNNSSQARDKLTCDKVSRDKPMYTDDEVITDDDLY